MPYFIPGPIIAVVDAVTAIRVVLAEDHPVFRHGIRRVLEQTPDIKVVGETGDAEECLALLKSLQPDVMVCDIRMPGLGGIELVRRCREQSPRTRSLVLSAYDDDEYILETLGAGASGYILKTVEANELAEAIRRVASGQTVLYPPAAEKLARLLSGVLPGGKSEPLSGREREIMGLAARGLSNKGIAKKLGLSVRTVEAHFSRIFVKLSVSSRLEAVNVARSRHLIDEEKG